MMNVPGTARTVVPGNHSYQETWGQPRSFLQERSSYVRPKRKPVPAHDQYELLQPSSNVTNEQRDNTANTDHGVPHHVSTGWLDGWLWETISFVVALACFAAIVGLLIVLDNKKVPSWPAGISVNAIIAVIVTVMKGGMGICIAQCLSQVKWSWFKQHRKLGDLEIIDEASRGVWGAGRLLFSRRAWYLAYVGSFVFLAAFLIGPTVQQMVEVRVRQIDLISNATLSICNSSQYEVIGLGAGPGLNRVNMPMIGAMYDGLLQTSSQSPLRPACPTGNCTYPRYQSLGVCHQCDDFSDQLIYFNEETNETMPTSIDSACSRHNDSCEIRWPGAGLQLDGNYGIINSTQDYSIDLDPALISYDNTTFHMFRVMTSRNWLYVNPPVEPVAAQCHVRFCVKTYEATMNGGEFHENVVATSYNDSYLDAYTYFGYQNHLIIPAKPCYINGSEKSEPWNDEDRARCVYNITASSALSLSNTLTSLTSGDGSGIVSNRPSFSNDVVQAIYGLIDAGDLSSTDLGSLSTIDRAFKSLADTTTNHARGSSAICGGAVAYGTQLSDELFIHVRWIWLIPTIIVLAFCLIFFVATVIQSWGDELWKSSPMAYVFRGPMVDDTQLSADDILRAKQLRSTSKLSTIEKASKQIEVRFDRRVRI